MLPIKEVSFGPKAALSRTARRFRRAGSIVAAALGAVALVLVSASAAAASLLIALVSNATTKLVLPIDLGTGVLGAGINVGTLTSSIAIPLSGPLTSLAYTPFLGGETLLSIGLTTGALGPIGLGGKLESEAVAITPNGEYAYVVNEEFNKAEGAVSVIKLATNEVLLLIKVGNEPEGIAFTPNGELAYVADKDGEGQGQVTVIENASNPMSAKVKTTINIGSAGTSKEKCLAEGKNPEGACVEPEKIAIGGPSGLLAYVADGAAGTVTVIDTATQLVVRTIEKVGEALVSNTEPDNIAITPSGELAYASDGSAGTIVPINLNTNKVEAAISVGGTTAQPEGLAITPNGKLLVVTDEEAGNVKTIEIAKNLITNTFSVPGEPDGVAITP